MRYTECRLTPIAQTLLSELREQTVDFRPNYASTAEEPIVLPAQYPEPAGQRRDRASPSAWRPTSRRTTSRKSATRWSRLLDNRELPLEKILKSIHGPDFPTGGVILNTRRRDPADLRDGAGDDQAPRHVRAAPRPAGRDPDHVDSLRHRERRPGRADRRADRQGAGPATDQRQGPEHRRRADLARAAGPAPIADAALAYLFKNSPLQINLQHQPDLPAAGRGGRGGGPRPARPEERSSSNSSTSGWKS